MSHFKNASTFINWVIKEANIDPTQSEFLHDHFQKFMKENLLTFTVTGGVPPYSKCAISESEWNEQMKSKVITNLKKQLSEEIVKRMPVMSDETKTSFKCELKVWIE